MDARRHLLEALRYGTPERPMPEPEPTLSELLEEACYDAEGLDRAIQSLKSELPAAGEETLQ